jgi:cysteine desulfurase
MGVNDRIGHGAVRWSLSRFTTESEIDNVLEVLPGLIAHLRATLPV